MQVPESTISGLRRLGLARAVRGYRLYWPSPKPWVFTAAKPRVVQALLRSLQRQQCWQYWQSRVALRESVRLRGAWKKSSQRASSREAGVLQRCRRSLEVRLAAIIQAGAWWSRSE